MKQLHFLFLKGDMMCTYIMLYLYTKVIDLLINPLVLFSVLEGHVALDRNQGLGCDTLLLRLIPGDLLSACPHRQFHTLITQSGYTTNLLL